MQQDATFATTPSIREALDGAPTAQHEPDWPQPRRAWITVWVLMGAYATAFVDRQILALLVEPIQRDLGISDTQFSLLTGLAFVFFYTVMGIPFAWVADKASRRNLIAGSLVTWSAMTAACGLATNMFTLFVARMGVGVGEAGLSPAAYSMISDSFPPARRASAIAVYSMGTILGTGLAFAVGGAVAQWAVAAQSIALPLFGEVGGWRLAFFAVALPGPLLALAMLALREPIRKGSHASLEGETSSASRYLRQHGPLLLTLAVGYSLLAMAFACYLSWTPAVMMRTYGWNIASVGAAFGATVLLCTGGGVAVGGWWANRLHAEGRTDAVILVSLAGGALALPFAILVPFASNGEVATLALAGMCLGWGLTHPMGITALQAIVPNRLRARIAAMYILLGNLIAFVVGTTAVALISDYVLRDPAKIGWALAIVSGAAIPLGLLVLVLMRRPYIRRVAELMCSTHQAP